MIAAAKASVARRVTLVIGTLGSGGAERNLLRLAEGLRDRGYVTTVMTLNPAVADFYALPEAVARATPQPEATLSPRWFDIPTQRRKRLALRESLLATQPDIVISFIDTVNVQVIAALAGTAVPVVVSERIDWRHHPLNWRWRALRRYYYPRARRVVALARAPVEEALKYWPRWRCVHIANPVPAIRVEKVQAPAWFHPHNLITMGRLVIAQKGQDLLLHAFAQLASHYPDWGLTIIGEGPDRAALEALARQLGLVERVHFAGNINPPFGLLAAADVFVFPSRYEAFGMALAEAMACGLPVISFDCPSGPADIVRHEVDGLLVPPANVSALTAAMGRLMGDRALRQRMAQRAPEVCERYAPERIYGQWVALIEDVLRESRRGVADR